MSRQIAFLLLVFASACRQDGPGTAGRADAGADRAIADSGPTIVDGVVVACSGAPACTCPVARDLTVCCTAGRCGWESHVSAADPCLPSVYAPPGCNPIGQLPPTLPGEGVLCVLADPGSSCAQGQGCPAALPAAGDPCTAVTGRCHYCIGENTGGFSRSVECANGQWVDLGASACAVSIDPPP
jgi:hypothetical protein